MMAADFSWTEVGPAPASRQNEARTVKTWKGTPPPSSDRGTRYQISRPGEGRKKKDQSAPAEQADNPAGRKSPVAPTATPPHVEEMVGLLKDLRRDDLTDERMGQLQTMLAGTGGRTGWPVADLKALKEALGVTAYGTKSEMARRIIEGAKKRAEEEARRKEVEDEQVELMPLPPEYYQDEQVELPGPPSEEEINKWLSGLPEEDEQVELGPPGPRKQAGPSAPIEFASRQEAESHLRGLVDNASRSSTATPEQKAAYQKSVQAVTARMPDQAVRRMAANTRALALASSRREIFSCLGDEMRRALASMPAAADRLITTMGIPVPDDETERLAVAERLFDGALRPALDANASDSVGGVYCDLTRTLVIDGAYDAEPVRGPDDFHFARGQPQEHIYAHEATHGIDGPDHDLSNQQAWQDAWRSELGGGGWSHLGGSRGAPLSEYAATLPQEGLAEFGRLLYGGGVDLDIVRQRFPAASRFFQENGLWPNP